MDTIMFQTNFVIFLWIFIITFTILYPDMVVGITKEERDILKEQTREMFYHAYHSYTENAYPADELMPLSCKGRYRDIEPSRGDVDDALGNFSLTLVDTLDTLVILGDLDEFERAIIKVIKDVSFDSDVVVSVFEVNIRLLGGLLSGHILASYIQEKLGRLPWYKGELLAMAKTLGFRLMPAFNTTTGVPHPRINLRYGLKSPKLGVVRETCTACAGTMILEFATLSRLTGEPIFEEKARIAMDYLWQQRHRTSDLMGTVLNIHSGDWVRRDSGVGAGIDSYYEYCLKAYILLGDDVFLERFNKHYSAVMKYISQGPLLVDVHMHRPHTNSRNFMDALLAFWPGLQVLKGDIKSAIETHEMLYQVMQRHNFLPEAFTIDFQVHWGQHPLRPEFVESTYFLYKATSDLYYLEAGKKVLDSLQKYARVPCGFAAVKDVRTGSHEDRMDSFVLAETFKYLYLLFASKEELLIDVDDFIFTTEAHLFPLSLSRLKSLPLVQSLTTSRLEFTEEDFAHSCPNTHYLFPEGRNFAHSVRQPLKNLVEGVCPSTKFLKHKRIHASEFQATNKGHLELIRKMGIAVIMLADGRIQLVHNTAQAETTEDAEEGVIFMQEMIELSKTQSHQEQHLRVVYFSLPESSVRMVLNAGPAQFGLDLKGKLPIKTEVEIAQPLRACTNIHNAEAVSGKIAIVERGDCMFIEKARHIQKVGALGGIVLDNHPGTSSRSSPMFAMSGDGKDDVNIPMAFLFSEDGGLLLSAYRQHPDIIVAMADSSSLTDDPTDDTQTKTTMVNQGKVFNSDAEIVNTQTSQIPPKSHDHNIANAQKRVQQLLTKLRSLQQIKVDLDQLLALTQELDYNANPLFGDHRKIPKSFTTESEFQNALERLMQKERILEIDQDVEILLSRLRELIRFHPLSADYSDVINSRHKQVSSAALQPFPLLFCVNPMTNVNAFLHMVMLYNAHVRLPNQCEKWTLLRSRAVGSIHNVQRWSSISNVVENNKIIPAKSSNEL